MPFDVAYDPHSHRTRAWDVVSGLLVYVLLLLGTFSLV